MSSEIAIKVVELSKHYQIYKQPNDRLKQFVVPRLQGVIGLQPKQYYQEFWALKDVNFEIMKGETVGILGRNGSGKSTLLQMICGTLNPSHGYIQSQGRLAALLELGSGFNPEFTGRENVYMNSAILGLSNVEISERFDAILSFADIGEFIEQPIKTYSSGMIVRLAFAIAINADPEILVVDEALSVGDFIFQQKCYRRIKELQSLGCTILLVSHDLAAIVQFCDRAYVLKSGELLFQGSAKDAVGFYKKIHTVSSALDITEDTPRDNNETSKLCTYYQISSRLQDYGDNAVEIYDWAVLDEDGNVSDNLNSEKLCTIIIRLRFLRQCTSPIVGYFLSDAQGREIVGANTEYLNQPLGVRTCQERVEVRFEQVLGISSGQYSLNLGCSEYIDGNIVAHHRMYDLCILTISRSSMNVGFYLPETNVSIERMP